jgi:hypothetical protein
MSDIKRYSSRYDIIVRQTDDGKKVEIQPLLQDDQGDFVLYEDHVKLIEERDLSVRMMIAANTHAREEAAKLVLSKDGLTTQNVILNQEVARQLNDNNALRKLNYALREEVAKQAERIRRLNKKLKKTKEEAR